MEKIYDLIIKELAQVKITAEISVEDGDVLLNVFADEMGPDKDDEVLMELEKLEIDDDGHGYYQMITIIDNNMPHELEPVILKRLNDLNKSTALGFYGILEDSGLLYHRYVAKLPNGSDEYTVNELIELIFDVLGVVNSNYNSIFREFD